MTLSNSGADCPAVTVIIPALDAEATISDQLDALAKQTYGGQWEVIVADNGSTDRTQEVVERFGNRLPNLKVVDASETRGCGAAKNVGARFARGSILCFCDADDVVSPGWLEAMVEASEVWEVVGGLLEVESLNDPTVRLWSPTPQAARDVDGQRWAPGGNMAISTALFVELGGFDPAYIKSSDIELSNRIWAAGHEIGFSEKAVIGYRYRSTLAGVAQQGYRTGRAGAQYCRDGTRSRRSLRLTVRDWGWLFTRLPTVILSARRGLWVRRSSEAAGRFVGSVKYRQRYL
jgi:glycosyltransferase involved in cell wall biosynthesis